MKVAIVGLGKYYKKVKESLKEDIEVGYYADNSMDKIGNVIENITICKLDEIIDNKVEYYIVSNISYNEMETQLLSYGVDSKKIILFFSDSINFELYSDVFQKEKAIINNLFVRLELVTCSVKQMKEKNELILDHIMYEVADKIKKQQLMLPKIASIEDTADEIIKNHKSISRFGDGEFQIILGAAKDKYQHNDTKLGIRLEEILKSNIDNHIVALADDYGDVTAYNTKTRTDIRCYMTTEKRQQHYQFIDFDKQYYNAYISRPYIYYPSTQRKEAEKRFNNLKTIWNNREVLIVEGEYTRMGVGNDLLNNAKSIIRILAPSENAFDKYDEILNAICNNFDKHYLILIALGPTATVLSYDLAKNGYWAVDIGHIDIEYEWFIRDSGKCIIPNKYTNEVRGGNIVGELIDEKYMKSIYKKIV